MNIVNERRDQTVVSVEVFFDTICPWCYIGKMRLDEALRQRPAARARMRWRPFLLNPEMPDEGVDRADYLRAKFGSPSRILRIQEAIATAAVDCGIRFSFDRIRRTPNSVDSHRLIRFADRYALADQTVARLFRAYFTDGIDLGDIDALVGLGQSLGLDGDALGAFLRSNSDSAAIYEDNSRAQGMGINGVPVFIFNGAHAIAGAHPPQVLTRMIDVALAFAA